MSRLYKFIIGILVLTLGVRIMYITGLGVAPWDSINIGLANIFNVEITIVLVVTSIVVLLFSYFLCGKVPSIFTIVTILLIGLALDFWSYIIDVKLTFTVNIYLLFAMGIIISSFGIAMYLSSFFPKNPIDFLTMCIKERFNIKIGTAKLYTDIVCILIAFIIQGPIGIGTVVACVLIGPMINLFSKITQ